jgi:plasmid stabilization system protein ParE
VKVIITPEARTDLGRIWSYIEQDNSARAIGFIREIGERCQRLSHMPLRYQLLIGHEESGIRRIPHGNYVIFYRIMPDAIYILHILNAAQDHEAILFPGKTADEAE